MKEISAKAHGDGYMSFSSNFWLDFVTVWGVIRLNLEPTQKADCISRIFIPKIDFPVCKRVENSEKMAPAWKSGATAGAIW